MRNLLQYPITADEAVREILKMSDEISEEGNMGDLRPSILHHAAELITLQPRVFEDLASVKSPKEKGPEGP